MLVTMHWVRWNEKDGKEVMIVMIIIKCMMFLVMTDGFNGLLPYAGYNALGSLENR